MADADGQEVLVVDGDERVQRGLAQLLVEHGLVPTVVSDAVRARELAREKYFAVALIDLDTPQTNAGLELTRWFKANAPPHAFEARLLPILERARPGHVRSWSRPTPNAAGC